MELGLKGKRAIVTGGSSGIGRAIALELAAEGVRIEAIGRDEGRLAEVARALSSAGDGFSIAADLATEEGCRVAVEACVQRYGGVDILVNCAGVAQQHPVLDLPGSLVEESIRLKLIGYLRMCQLVIPLMRSQHWGRIINIAGDAGTQPGVNNLPSSFANAGVLNLTRVLTDVTAADGILVNAICPGPTETPRIRRHRIEAAAREGRELDLEAELAAAGKLRPAGRICQPEEVARVACFLASEACSYVFASAIYMEGGIRRSMP